MKARVQPCVWGHEDVSDSALRMPAIEGTIRTAMATRSVRCDSGLDCRRSGKSSCTARSAGELRLNSVLGAAFRHFIRPSFMGGVSQSILVPLVGICSQKDWHMREKHPDTCAVVFDPVTQRVLEFRKTMLINQISRDAEKIAQSFDALHSADLEKMSALFAHCSAILASGLIKAEREEDDLRMACAELLYNSLKSKRNRVSAAKLTIILLTSHVMQVKAMVSLSLILRSS